MDNRPQALLLSSPFLFSRMLVVELFLSEFHSLATLEESLESIFSNASEYDLQKELFIDDMQNFQCMNTMEIPPRVLFYEVNKFLDNIFHQLYACSAYRSNKLLYCGVEMIEPETLLFWRDPNAPCSP